MEKKVTAHRVTDKSGALTPVPESASSLRLGPALLAKGMPAVAKNPSPAAAIAHITACANAGANANGAHHCRAQQRRRAADHDFPPQARSQPPTTEPI